MAVRIKKAVYVLVLMSLTLLTMAAAYIVPEKIMGYVDSAYTDEVNYFSISTQVYDNSFSSFYDRMRAIMSVENPDKIKTVELNVEEYDSISDENITDSINEEIMKMHKSGLIKCIVEFDKTNLVEKKLLSLYCSEKDSKVTGINMWQLVYRSDDFSADFLMDMEACRLYSFVIASEKCAPQCRNVADVISVRSTEMEDAIKEYYDDITDNFEGRVIQNNLWKVMNIVCAMSESDGNYDAYTGAYKQNTMISDFTDKEVGLAVTDSDSVVMYELDYDKTGVSVSSDKQDNKQICSYDFEDFVKKLSKNSSYYWDTIDMIDSGDNVFYIDYDLVSGGKGVISYGVWNLRELLQQ